MNKILIKIINKLHILIYILILFSVIGINLNNSINIKINKDQTLNLNNTNIMQHNNIAINSNNIDTYFPKQYYATVYEPARCLYHTQEEYEQAVKLYKEDYLVKVGSLDNTFEERFRGNTQIKMTIKRDSQNKKVLVTPHTKISVYNQEARDYLINTVLPEMSQDGIDVTITKDKIEYDLANKNQREDFIEYLDLEAYEKYNVYTSQTNKITNYPTYKWEFDVPKELVDIFGEYYKKYFNNEQSPLTNNPFISYNDYVLLSENLYRIIKADYNTKFYDIYKLVASGDVQLESLYNILYYSEQKIEKVASGTKIEDYYYYIEKDGKEVPYTSSGYVAKDNKGNFIYDENGFIKQKLYTTDQVKKDNDVFERKMEYNIVFKNYDGTIISEKKYHYGEKIEFPSDPVKEEDEEFGYRFDGWDCDIKIVTGDIEFIAQYTPVKIVFESSCLVFNIFSFYNVLAMLAIIVVIRKIFITK